MPALMIHQIHDVTVVNFNETSILDTAQVDQLGKQLDELVDKQACRKILLDFAKVKLLSSSALGVLVTLQKKTRQIKGRAAICSLRPELRKVFKITSLDKLFDFYDDEAGGLASFGVTAAG